LLKRLFIEPTIIENLAHYMPHQSRGNLRCGRDNHTFDSEDEVLKLRQLVEYGLSATVWTENLSRAHRVAEKLESGIIWINTWLLRDLRTPFRE
jgi:aminomuconate-semialdehyde/2-hydroxymuconate-6-semialdehyde dehydrogenase